MPFYIRKAVSVGPFRFNLSKGGIGLSAGIKGLRIGSGPRGNYIHMGRHGLYYRASLGSGRQPPRSPAHQPPVAASDAVAMSVVEVGEVLEMRPADPENIIAQINQRLRSFPFWPFVIALVAAILYLAFLDHLNEYYYCVLTTFGVILVLAAAYRDKIRRTVVIMYDLDDASQRAFSLLCESFDKMAGCSKIWNINTTGTERDWKRHAGAQRVIDRSSVKFFYSVPSLIKTNANIPSIVGGKQSIYFFPDIALIRQGRHVGGMSYSELRVNWGVSIFVEDETVPRDSVIDGYTWRYVNKSGGPDRRFNNNKQIPIVRYQVMEVLGPNRFRKILHLSRIDDYEDFDVAMRSLSALSKTDVGDTQNAANKIEVADTMKMKRKLSWKFLPNAAKTKNKVQIFAECQCGNTINYDDTWGDGSRVVCAKCGLDHGTFGDFKKQAREAVNDFISGNFWKYEIKAPASE